MKQISLLKLIGISFFLLIGTGLSQTNNPDYDQFWPAWRGPLMTGEAPTGNPPLEWSESQNVRWKLTIPGKGLSTPVIWGDQIFLTTAVATDKQPDPEKIDAHKDKRPLWLRMSGKAEVTEFFLQFMVLAISRKDGKIIWQKMVREEYPHESRHADGSWASNSCVTDGKHLFAFFGSFGLYCFDLKGNLIWEKDLGTMHTKAAFGEGSSPALYQDYLIVNWDHEEDSFIFALNKNTGDIFWQKARDENTSWSTPVVVEVNGKPQIVVSATNKSRAYDLKTGEVIWELGGLTGNVVPTPVHANGLVYLMSGFRGNALQVVNLNQAKGNIENSAAVVWTDDKNTPYVPSPLFYQDKIYYLKSNRASLTCADALTGEIHFTKEDLEDMQGVFASPVAAANRIYIAGKSGLVYILKAGPQLEILTQNKLEDSFDASPAIVGKELYLRGLKYLYCIAEN